MTDTHEDIRQKILDVLEYGAEEDYELHEVLDAMDSTVKEIKDKAALQAMKNIAQMDSEDDD